MPYLPSSSARLIFCGPDPPDPPLAGSDPDLCEDDPFTPFAPVAPPPAPFTAVVVAAAVGAGAGAGVGLTLAPPRAVGTGAKSNRSSSRSTFFACEAAGLDAAVGAGAGGAEAAGGAGAAGADLTGAAARAAAAAASSRSALHDPLARGEKLLVRHRLHLRDDIRVRVGYLKYLGFTRTR